MYLDEINNLASNAGLTSYEGDEQNPYTGFGDDLVDFGGKNLDFASEIATDRIFSITIANTTGADQTVLLVPSYVPSIPANVATDGAIIVNLVGSGAPKTIKNFLSFVAMNPTSVVAMRITSNQDMQLAQVINILRKSPFRDLENEQIVISSFTTEFATNSKMVTIRRPFQIDNQTEVNVVVPNNATTTFSFYCGAVLNTAKALNAKSNRAGRNSKVAGSRALIAAK